MILEEIKENLCVYDKRHPDNLYGDLDEEDLKDRLTEDCFCDNCFYGRHNLANELLKYVKD